MSPSGRSSGRGWTCPPVFFSLFEQEVSLCERVGCFRNCATFLNTRCLFYLCGVALLCASMRISSMYFITAMRMLRWFTDSISLQTVLTVSGLALKWVPSFIFPSLRVPCSKLVVPGTTGCPDSSLFKSTRGFFCPNCRSDLRIAIVITPGIFRADGTPVSRPEACCVVTNFLRVLDAQVVVMVVIRVRNAFLTDAVESRRCVLFDRRQQLCGGKTRIEDEFAVEEFRVDAF